MSKQTDLCTAVFGGVVCGKSALNWRHTAGPYSDEESHPFQPATSKVLDRAITALLDLPNPQRDDEASGELTIKRTAPSTPSQTGEEGPRFRTIDAGNEYLYEPIEQSVTGEGRWAVHFVCRSATHGHESVFAFCRDEKAAGEIEAGLEARHAGCPDTYCATLPEEDFDDRDLALAKWKDAFFTVEMERASLARELAANKETP